MKRKKNSLSRNLSWLLAKGASSAHWLTKIFRRLSLVLGVVLLLMAGWMVGNHGAYGPGFGQTMPKLQMLSVSFGDPYAWTAELLKQELESHGIPVELDNTSLGSLTNLVKVDEGSRTKEETERRLKLAIVQADVAYYYVRGNHPHLNDAHPNSRVRAVGKLFTERLEMWTEPANGSYDLMTLERVCTKNVGSGSMSTMRNVGRILGPNWKDYYSCRPESKEIQGDNSQKGSKDEKAKRDVKGNKDEKAKPPTLCARVRGFSRDEFGAADAKGQAPIDSSKEACDLGAPDAALFLLGFDQNAAGVLVDSTDGRVYRESSLRKDSKTIEMDALLIVDQDIPNHIIVEIQNIIDVLAKECKASRVNASGSNLLTQVCAATDFGDSSKDRYENLPISMHPAILMKQLGPVSRAVVQLTDPFILRLLLVILLGITLVASAIPRLGSIVHRRANVSIADRIADFILSTQVRWLGMIVIVIAFHLAIGVLVWLSEFHEHALASDTDYLRKGVFKAIDWVFQYTIAGISPIELKSDLSVFWVGVLKAGWAFASAALFIGLANVAWSGWRSFRMGDHVVIIGLNEYSNTLIEELRNMQVSCNVIATRKLSDLSETGSNTEVNWYDVSPKDVSVEHLLKVLIKYDAKAVIVVSDREKAKDENQGDVDSWVCRQVYLVDKVRNDLYKKQSKNGTDIKRTDKKNRLPIIAEIQHVANYDIARKTGADKVVCQNRFATQLIAQAAAKHEMLDIFDELLGKDSPDHELALFDLSSYDIATYGDFDRLLRHYRDSEGNRTPIGIRRGKKTLLNPVGQDAQLKPGDKIISLARR